MISPYLQRNCRSSRFYRALAHVFCNGPYSLNPRLAVTPNEDDRQDYGAMHRWAAQRRLGSSPASCARIFHFALTGESLTRNGDIT